MSSQPLIIEDVYQTPAGYRDFPFIYKFDGSQLVTGKDYRGLTVPMAGDGDFILRGIVGMNTLAYIPTANQITKFAYKDAASRYRMSQPEILVGYIYNGTGISSSLLAAPYPVVPEVVYPYNGQIVFDLYNAQPTPGCSVSDVFQHNGAMLGFVGVKRLSAAAHCAYETPYKFRKLPKEYVYNLTVDWAAFDANGAPTPPRRFEVPIQNWDFELQQLKIVWTNAAAIYGLFGMTLYDNANIATSSAPIPYQYLVGMVPTQLSLYGPQIGSWAVHPTPPLVYMVNGKIAFDIQSNYCPGDIDEPYTVNMVFQGVERHPCQ